MCLRAVPSQVARFGGRVWTCVLCVACCVFTERRCAAAESVALELALRANTRRADGFQHVCTLVVCYHRRVGGWWSSSAVQKHQGGRFVRRHGCVACRSAMWRCLATTVAHMLTERCWCWHALQWRMMTRQNRHPRTAKSRSKTESRLVMCAGASDVTRRQCALRGVALLSHVRVCARARVFQG